MKKKKGFLLVEVIIILNMLVMLLMLFSKQIHVNMKKIDSYGIKPDILTITKEEELFLIELNNMLFEECHKGECIGCLNEDEKKYLYSENLNISIDISDDYIFLINESEERTIESRMVELIKNSEDECMLIPTKYLKIENKWR